MDAMTVIKAWKDREFRESLSVEEAQELPPHPAGMRVLGRPQLDALRVPPDDEDPTQTTLDRVRAADEDLRSALAVVLDEARGLEAPALDDAGATGEVDGDCAAAYGFLHVVRPLVAHAYVRFRRGLVALRAAYPGGPLGEFPSDGFDRVEKRAVVGRDAGDDVFVFGLASQLLGLLGRTLVLELNSARVAGRLHGDTSEARFARFIESLQQESMARAILFEYPVLTRRVIVMLAARVEARLECLRHLCEDWVAITRRWPAFTHARLAGVSAVLDDPRRGGRSALRLRFTRGCDAQDARIEEVRTRDLELVHLPRSVAVDVHLQQVLAWLNARGATPAFRVVDVLECGDRGWVEAIGAMPCDSPDAVTRFCERLGGLLALLHALGAIDVTPDHLVAHGEHPVLIGVDSLFQPSVCGQGDHDLSHAATRALAESVIRLGLVSAPGWPRALLAGVGERDASRVDDGSRMVCVWERAGTDETQIVVREGGWGCAAAGPIHQGQRVNLAVEAPAIERGFERVYRLLLDGRSLFVDEHEGPIHWFAADRIRVCLRPAAAYHLVRQDATHPDVLRSDTAWCELLDWLRADATHEPALADAVDAECRDLANGDVPTFTTTPATRAVHACTGEELASLSERSGLDQVERRVRAMSEADLERQRWFLRASLAACRGGDCHLVTSSSVPALAPPAAAEEFVEAAARVAHRLRTLAFVEGECANWVGLRLAGETRWSVGPLGLDLHGGLPGVALFLARLANRTEDTRHQQLAAWASAGVLSQIAARAGELSVGALSGRGGVIYALAHLGVLWKDERYLDVAARLSAALREEAAHDLAFDIADGAAGAVMGLAALQSVRPTDATLDAVRACARHLIAHAEDQGAGCGWWTHVVGYAPLLGFSRGAAGIALALLTASALTSDELAHETAARAIEYERHAFVRSVRNWPDFRRSGDSAGTEHAFDVRFGTSWCHGAPGVGLARVAGLRHLDHWRIRLDVSDAVKTTIRSGFGSNHSLCHGDLGNLEFLMVAAARLGDSALRRDALQMAAGLLRSIDERGWRCGTPEEVETPGFMVGLSGIGDGLLRIGAPELPSVLMFEPPVSAHGRAVRRRLNESRNGSRPADVPEPSDADSGYLNGTAVAVRAERGRDR